MPIENTKIFLNQEIRGDHVKASGDRVFGGAAKIRPPRYDSRYFETFPTVWAVAYEFQKLIKLSTDPNAEKTVLVAAHQAVEEWVCLFLLHYSGVINPYVYKKDDEKEKDDFSSYDPDLWDALSGTYPFEELKSVTLLRADDSDELGSGTVVGACYPEIFLFPSRGRASWAQSQALEPYLEGKRLSWEKCRKSELLKKPQDQVDFSAHLLSIKNELGQFGDALNAFRDKEINAGHLPATRAADKLDVSILNWKRQVVEEAELLMNNYPLVWERQEGNITKRTYYFVDNMPGREGWMSEAIRRGMPWPRNFTLEEGNPRKVLIKHAGRPIPYDLKENEDVTEDVVRLKECFLSVNPYWCAIPSDTKDFAATIRKVHKVSTKREKPFASLQDGEAAVCLAPVSSLFLQNFSRSGLLTGVKAEIGKVEEERDEGGLDWVFEFEGRGGKKQVRWTTKIEQRSDLSNNSVAMWPPEASDDWHFYVARCFGSSKSKSGTWVLVDENGQYEAKPFNLDVALKEGKTDVTEYVSHIPLSKTSTEPNKPKFLMLLDTDEKVERGVLFLDDSISGNREKQSQPSATLAIDFGTSNTCVAYGVDNERRPLVFDRPARMLWGREPNKEIPGRVPFNWQRSQFYPTILMSRKKSGLEKITPDQLKAGNLFQVDIPSLHKGMEDSIYAGVFDGWTMHTNLKWKLKVEHNPYRTLFLGLSLLYAHAETFFQEDKGIQIEDYVFSFPLAFSSAEEAQFCRDAKAVAKTIRHLCYGDDGGSYYKIDESTAIAVESGTAEQESTLQVFVDVGGGTTDIAIRHREKFPSRDSIKVAGRTFFSFAEENFEGDVKGSKDFKTNLARLLLKEDKELRLDNIRLDLGTYYSLAVSRLESSEFREREAVVLQKGMGNDSYQRYRTLVFFRQIIAYALLQACAAAVTSESNITSLQVIFAGNAWGLMLFAGLARRGSEGSELKKEVDRIFRVLQKTLAEILQKENKSDRKRAERISKLNSLKDGDLFVQLLNEKELTKAKTAVALGAVKALKAVSKGGTQPIADSNPNDDSPQQDERDASAFTGLTFVNAKVNTEAIPIKWYDNWDVKHFKKIHKKELGQITSFTTGALNATNQPFDELLSVFSRLANLGSYDDADSLTKEEWQRINALLHQDKIYYNSTTGLGLSPISYFIGELLYPEDSEHEYLKNLARSNKCL